MDGSAGMISTMLDATLLWSGDPSQSVPSSSIMSSVATKHRIMICFILSYTNVTSIKSNGRFLI
jgi:hypothetical protein